VTRIQGGQLRTVVQFLAASRDFSKTGYRVHSACHSVDARGHSPAVKWPGCDSPLSGAELKNDFTQPDMSML
jgi:hypothetical protein